ncbi:MAG: SAM-dependent methyltransferase [Betaproteobacteria bacterium]|nr:SAM-dependent methyltransferase [Betaproteobacteria bacterium]
MYLLPVDLGGEDPRSLLPPATVDAVRGLRTFIVENAKSARRFLKAVDHSCPLQEISFHLFDEHTSEADIEPLLDLLLKGENCGLMSEAGCPAVADPGARLVRRAHESGVRVVPLVGPSSLLLALMASGMNGQRFAFHGYLPVDRTRRAHKLKDIETRAQTETQIFIETPYRNAALLNALLEHCRGDTLLCIAADLTLPTESVVTRAVAQWKKKPPALDRRLVVFLLYRGNS